MTDQDTQSFMELLMTLDPNELMSNFGGGGVGVSEPIFTTSVVTGARYEPLQNVPSTPVTIEQLQLHDMGYNNTSTGSGYDSIASPPLSTTSSSSCGGLHHHQFSFPTPAPTPELVEADPTLPDTLEDTAPDLSLFAPEFVFGEQQQQQQQPVQQQYEQQIPEQVDAMKEEEDEQLNKPVKTKKQVKTRLALAKHIRGRRGAAGLAEIDPLKEDGPKENINVLTPDDIRRKERRKASNRRAAAKAREKKKVAEDKIHQTMEQLKRENAQLKEELEKLSASKTQMETKFNQHLEVCPLRVLQR